MIYGYMRVAILLDENEPFKTQIAALSPYSIDEYVKDIGPDNVINKELRALVDRIEPGDKIIVTIKERLSKDAALRDGIIKEIRAAGADIEVVSRTANIRDEDYAKIIKSLLLESEI